MIDRITEEHLDANVSVKLTQMGQDIDAAFLRQNVGRIVDRAREVNMFVRFDMEASTHTQPTLDFFRSLWDEGYHDIGIVLQSYMRRSEQDARMANELGVRVRLCKGAYREPPVAFQAKSEVDRNYVALMKLLLTEGTYPGIATHDEAIIRTTAAFAKEKGLDGSAFEFQMLYGVRRDLQRMLVDRGYTVRVYVPFGREWYPYFMRRLAERPANVGFMLKAIAREEGRRLRHH
jgi:proline dehydrogenase